MSSKNEKTGGMAKFDADTLYSLSELRAMLCGVVELPTLIDRLGLRTGRIFRDAVWGWEILEAAKMAGSFTPHTETKCPNGGSKGTPGMPSSRSRKCRNEPVRRLGAPDLADSED